MDPSRRSKQAAAAVALLALVGIGRAHATDPDELMPCQVFQITLRTIRFFCRAPHGVAFALPTTTPPVVVMASFKELGGQQRSTHNYTDGGGPIIPLGTPPGSKGYKLRSRFFGHYCTILLRTDLVRGLCGNQGLAPPIAGDMALVLDVTANTPFPDPSEKLYCGRFGGTQVANNSVRTRWQNAPAPASCSP